VIDIKQLQRFFELDESIEWNHLEIKPILIRDYYDFALSQNVLNIDKSKTNDLNIIKMTYLDYLYYLMVNEDKYVIASFMKIMELCLGLNLNEWRLDYDDKKRMKIVTTKTYEKIIRHDEGRKPITKTVTIEINYKQFDELRKIINFQNFIDYDDSFISDDVRQAISDYNQMVNKDIESPTLEKMIACIQTNGFAKKDILNMTYRSFKLLLDTIDNKLTYQIMKTGEMSGMVTFKEPISHWIYKKKQDKIAECFGSREKLEENIR